MTQQKFVFNHCYDNIYRKWYVSPGKENIVNTLLGRICTSIHICCEHSHSQPPFEVNWLKFVQIKGGKPFKEMMLDFPCYIEIFKYGSLIV